MDGTNDDKIILRYLDRWVRNVNVGIMGKEFKNKIGESYRILWGKRFSNWEYKI